MDIQYINKIKSWVECDNVLVKRKADIKDLTDKKKELEEDILQYVEDNKYDKLTINISDGAIKFSKRNITQSLSMKLLKNALESYNENVKEIDVQDIIQHVSEQLETKQKIIMTRDFNN
jgi:chromosomal replication initiation ATPase DnaA